MKKLSILILPFFLYGASPFVDDNTVNQSNTTIPKNENITLDLKAIQKSFLKGENGNSKSILNIKYQHNKTYRIKTRQTMQTFIILDNDTIAYHFFGDKSGFKINPLGKKKFDFRNMLIVEPILNGIDTNLTIIGESGKIYSFYLYSTDYKSKTNPNLIVFVSSDREEIGKIEIENLELKEFKNAQKKYESNKVSKEELNNVMILGTGINQLNVKLSEIVRNEYKQDGDTKLLALDIFRDNQFTYLKYNNKSALFKFPVAYKVADGYDTPVKQRIVGDYLVIETIADGYTLRLGDQHVCVRKKIEDE